MSTPEMPSWQSMFNWVAGGIGVILTGALAIVGFWFRRYIDKIDALEKQSHEYIKEAELSMRYATAAQMAALEKRIEGLVTRRELLAHLSKLAEERQRNHEENISRLDRNGTDIHGIRDEVGNTQDRIDKIYDLLMERSNRR